MRISDWSSDVCSSDLEQDRLGERAVDRREETRNVGLLCHQTSAPPPKEKKERKKLDAAKAIDRPKTIWTSRRNPPEVSPKARLRPVTMMLITATILATGPSMLSRIDWSGASQGIDEPPAWAGTAAIIATTIADAGSMARRAPCRAARIMRFLLLVE